MNEEALSMVRDGAMTIQEAMRFAGVSRSTLYEAMARGELAFVKIGTARRIPRRALELWLARNVMVGNRRVVDEG